MKKTKYAVLGFGGRGEYFARYSLLYPEQAEVVAVIDRNAFILDSAKKKLCLSDQGCYLSLNNFIKDRIECDFVINATMDEVHYETTKMLLNAGYNVLLEKPVTSNFRELLELKDLALSKGRKLLVCHVLRYTPFYKKIKEIINSKEIGRVMNLQLNEHVWHGHFVNAYVRGKWRSEKDSGSGLLLAKSCHDTDLICWLNNETTPTEVASFGSRAFYNQENAPEGATEYCYNCPKKDECIFDSMKFELKLDCCPRYTYWDLNKPIDKLSEEEKIEYLKSSNFGKCVYNCGMDIVDKQSVIVNFKNGTTATLNVVGGATKAGRHIHVICEYGEIFGYIEENKLIYRKFNKDAVNVKYRGDEYMYTDIEIDLNKDLSASNAETGHYGGDYNLIRDFISLLNEGVPSISTTDINDSVNGHLVVYAAEKSRKEKKVVSLDEFK